MTRVLKLNSLTTDEKQKLFKRSESDISETMNVVQPVIDDIRAQGGDALINYVRKFDHPDATLENLAATPEDFDRANDEIPGDLKDAIDHAYRNIVKAHRAQLRDDLALTEVEPGVYAGEKTTPIPRVGLYVPRGKGSFPSVMLMLAAPAQVAGVPEIVVCTPPGPEGDVDAASLYAAKKCGVQTIFKAGGAQAIAAMGLGAAPVPKADKLFGPCNAYGSAAKRILSAEVNVGMPAGPSESIVLADEFADPEMAARDLLVEAEHGPDSAALLVTHSSALADAVAKALQGLIEALPEPRREFCQTGLNSYGGILLTDSAEASFEFVNEWAPEHLLVLFADAWSVVDRITNAGEILIGRNTPIPLGNFAIGVNAILPTGRWARSWSATSVRDFQKTISLAYVTPNGFDGLQKTVRTLADWEGFPAHEAAVAARASSDS